MFTILRHFSDKEKTQGRSDGKKYGPGQRDTLTGAANKGAFQKIVENALTGEHAHGCLLLVDVDCMQEINESFGRETGDRVLQKVFTTLRKNFRGEDCVGRLGDDSFGIWIEGLSADQVSGIRRRIAVVNDMLMHGGAELPRVTLSAGAALGESGESYKEIYRQAQKVLHRVKEGGRCGCEIYAN